MCIISLILIVPETTKVMFDKYLEKGDECVDMFIVYVAIAIVFS